MKIKGLALEILELIAVSVDFPCRLINRFECSSRNIYRIIGRLIDAGLMIGKDTELLKKILLSNGGTENQLFKVDNTFNEFYYVPEDKNGDFMISILINKEIRNQIDKELVEMFEHRGVVVCFESRKEVIEEYFGELADIVVVEEIL